MVLHCLPFCELIFDILLDPKILFFFKSEDMAKILNHGTLNLTLVIVLKNGTVWFYNAVVHPKDADGMANSVDPDLIMFSQRVAQCLVFYSKCRNQLGCPNL